MAKCGKGKKQNGWLIWFGGRRTAIAVSGRLKKQAAILAAKIKLKRGNKSVVADSRRATDAEQKLLDKGIWVRSGPNGKASGFKGMRGQGPPVGGY